MSHPAPLLERRNVEVFDSRNEVIAGMSESLSSTMLPHLCAGFWQYGTLQWDEFYGYLTDFVRTTTEWSIFSYEPNQPVQQYGVPHPRGVEIVQAGNYILLSTSE